MIRAFHLWLSRLSLSPVAARAAYLQRCLERMQTALDEQETLIQQQSDTLKHLQAAVVTAQFDAEHWKVIAREQARQMQLRRMAGAGPQLPKW